MKNRINYFSILIIVMLLLILVIGAILAMYFLHHLRPSPDWKLTPVFQTDAIWYSQDGRFVFETKRGHTAEGTINVDEQIYRVEVSPDISGNYAYVFFPSFSEDGTPLQNPSLHIEEWEFLRKGEDWFIVEVVESTYYEKGDKITFYMQEGTGE